jgi:hypothetical protein
MKIENEKIVDISMGISDEKTFKLDQDSGILYDILRSKMYRDPISSIVREVASNARDANREAGHPEKPIKVFFASGDEGEINYLFDNDSTSINFQDNGLGMNPDRIEDIYLTYGASDKRDTDGLTGGWGLGAKTPFAHSDSFAVTTVCDYKGKRIKYTYIASIDSTNKGKFSLLDEEETTEETGTVVSLPIEKGFVHKFKEACNHYFQHWDVEIEGFPLVVPDKTYTTHNIYEVNTEETKAFLVIDGIYYPLMEHKDLNTKEFFDNLGIKLKVGLKFKTGELAVQPSREDVRYTDETIATINASLDKLDFREILVDVFKDVDCKNFNRFTLPQLYKNIHFIKDPKLKSILTTFYPKYKKGGYRDEPNIGYLKTYEAPYWRTNSNPIEKDISLTKLIQLVSNDNTAYILSPSGHKFKYKRNKLALLKKETSSIIFKNQSYLDEATANEVSCLVNCLSDVKYDHEMEYESPVRKSVSGFTGVSFRCVKQEGEVLNLKDMERRNLKVDPEKDYVIFVDNLSMVDKISTKYLRDLFPVLAYISKEYKYKFIFVSNRYKKTFEDNPKFSDYIKTNEYKNIRSKYRKETKDNSIKLVLRSHLSPSSAYYLYEDLGREFRKFLLPPKDMTLGSYGSGKYMKDKNIGKTDNSTVIEYTQKMEDIKSLKGELFTFTDTNGVSNHLSKSIIDKLKTIKDVREEIV